MKFELSNSEVNTVVFALQNTKSSADGVLAVLQSQAVAAEMAAKSVVEKPAEKNAAKRKPKAAPPPT